MMTYDWRNIYMKLGVIEAGGTKIICGIGTKEGVLLEYVEFPTEKPALTVPKIIKYFENKEIEALGIGTFGPVDVHEDSDTYGYILETPKDGWRNYDLLGKLKEAFNIPMIIDTDVNGAALAEATWGAAKDKSSCLYMTIGTGIGGGIYVNGGLIHGLLHPEMGHIVLRKHKDDNFEGLCPSHGDCFEGLAAGPAIEKRWNMKGIDIPRDHVAWDIEAYYIAQALVNYIMILSPEKIVLGGGVMKQKQLFPKIREEVKKLLAGYIVKPELTTDIDDYIVYPELGDNAGTYGALALAKRVLDQ